MSKVDGTRRRDERGGHDRWIAGGKEDEARRPGDAGGRLICVSGISDGGTSLRLEVRQEAL